MAMNDKGKVTVLVFSSAIRSRIRTGYPEKKKDYLWIFYMAVLVHFLD
jgi:hypothetical protein